MIYVKICKENVEVAHVTISNCATIDDLLYWVRLSLIQYPDGYAVFDYSGSTYTVRWGVS